MCCDENVQNDYLTEIIERILILQQRGNNCDDDNTCTRPFLGPSSNILCLNTRPVSFYSCCNNNLWSMPYTLGETTSTSSVFRIEGLDEDCVTCRVLAPNTDTTSNFPYLATSDFFTIKLKCIGILRCLGDTTVTGV